MERVNGGMGYVLRFRRREGSQGLHLPREKHVHVVIPEGTKVLTRSGGRVGVVSHAPDAPEHGYRVRFPDGAEESYRRADLTIFKHVQAEVPGGPACT